MEDITSINQAVKSNKDLVEANDFASVEARTGVCTGATEYGAALAWAGYRLFDELWGDDNHVIVAVPDKYVRNEKPELFGFQFFVNEPGWFVDENGGKTAVIVFTEDDIHASSEAWIVCDEVFSEHFKEYTQIVGKYWGVRLSIFNDADDNIGRLLHKPYRITAPRREGKVDDENR